MPSAVRERHPRPAHGADLPLGAACRAGLASLAPRSYLPICSAVVPARSIVRRTTRCTQRPGSVRSVEIRAIAPSEHDRLGEITVAAFRSLTRGRPLGSYEDRLRDVAGRVAECVVLVALADDGSVIGGVTYVPHSRTTMSEFDDDDAAGMRMLAVDPERQRAGAGRSLTLACIDRARSDGLRRFLLHSTPEMTVAQGMYERLGFQRCADRDEWVIDPPNDEPVHLMGYVLHL